jgi:hypothetical protein
LGLWYLIWNDLYGLIWRNLEEALEWFYINKIFLWMLIPD